ncbi:MAG: hypothetical protein MJZ20_10970 [Bacteroidaceae bacterium]|nr:hypothetical protein [Bacteroidaceae bacterium]
MKGIDVSRWQGDIDWCAVKKSGAVDFCIIKIGGNDTGTLYKDAKFTQNYYGCKGHNIPCGCYFFLGKQINSVERGRACASQILSLIKGYKFEFPIWIDVEQADKKTKQDNTDAVKAICEVIEKAGYYVGIYGSDINTFDEMLNTAQLSMYDKWVARYPLSSKNKHTGGLRQYSSTGSIAGIKGNVDLDESYYGYPEIMKNKHLNGY